MALRLSNNEIPLLFYNQALFEGQFCEFTVSNYAESPVGHI